MSRLNCLPHPNNYNTTFRWGQMGLYMKLVLVQTTIVHGADK